ncbi:GNAT family protein [Pedobacter sp. JY14-1]|uniref:GNAT family N-acetyltransferase n=1 Tax=Pedobacter sp. JY14-1 TaxID=3034151 RepID=UPI0023E31E0B|nr:GNAT family protein [Pedobacter sp. JY14-1]
MQEILTGKYIRLEPLGREHLAPLVEAAKGNENLFKWTFVPQGEAAMAAYIDTALQQKADGQALPYVIANIHDGRVLGSTRYWNLQHWAWPEGHQRYGKQTPDVCEIGYTWLTADAIRTPVNTEAKLLLLSNAFTGWQALRVCFQTDARNARSRAAIERIGGRYEGIIRAERLASDNTIRDTARFSIIAEEWPAIAQRLKVKLYTGAE